MGSTNFAALMLCIGAGTNIIFTILTLILYIFTGYKPFMMSQSGGLWQLIFGIIAMECSFAPEGSKRSLFIVEVPARYYPLVLWGLFTLFTGSGRFLESMADLCSIGIGYAYGIGKLEFLKISVERRRRLEQGVLKSFTSRVGWVVGPARNDWVMVAPTGTSTSWSGSNRNAGDEEQGWTPSVIRTRESSIPTSTSNTGERLGGSGSGSNNNSSAMSNAATRRSNVTSNSNASTSSSAEKQSARQKLLAAAEQRAIEKKRNAGEE